MLRRSALLRLVVAGSCAFACANPDDPARVLNDAADALGGRDRVRTLVREGEGDNYNLGQNRTPPLRRAPYGEVEGLRLPMHLTTKLDRYTTADIRLSNVSVDSDPGASSRRTDVRAATPTAAAVKVAVDAIAPGVWYLAGQSHHSVLIEFADHLMLVEAPQSEPRTLAVIAHARQLVPTKPLRYVGNTHDQWTEQRRPHGLERLVARPDDIGGLEYYLRTYVALDISVRQHWTRGTGTAGQAHGPLHFRSVYVGHYLRF